MEQHGQLITSLESLVLELPPSCIEFCSAYPDYLVVGTYELQRDEDQNPDPAEDGADEEAVATATAPRTQSRNGSLVVFRVNGNAV